MNMFFTLAVTWFGQKYRFLGLDWNYLVILGMIGNAALFPKSFHLFEAFYLFHGICASRLLGIRLMKSAAHCLQRL